MGISDRYVLGLILRTFLPVCLGLCFLFFVGASFRLLREEDLSLSQVAMALPWVIPFLLPYLIPMAWAGTLALIYGRLVAENEVLAFGSLGIPARSLAWPAIVFAGLLSLFCAWLAATVVPFCHQQRKEAVRAVFKQLLQLRDGEHLSRTFKKQGFDLYVRNYGPRRMEGIVLHYEVMNDLQVDLAVQLVARRGHVSSSSGGRRLELVLEDVTATLVPRGGAPPVRAHLERYVQGVSVGGRRRFKVRDHPSPALRAQVAAVDQRMALAAATGGLLALHEGQADRGLEAGVELATRTTLSLAPLLMTLLTIPVTLWVRARSPLVPFVLSMIVVGALFFGPLLFAGFLAESTGSEWAAYLGVALSLTGAAGLASLARRS